MLVCGYAINDAYRLSRALVLSTDLPGICSSFSFESGRSRFIAVQLRGVAIITVRPNNDRFFGLISSPP